MLAGIYGTMRRGRGPGWRLCGSCAHMQVAYKQKRELARPVRCISYGKCEIGRIRRPLSRALLVSTGPHAGCRGLDNF